MSNNCKRRAVDPDMSKIDSWTVGELPACYCDQCNGEEPHGSSPLTVNATGGLTLEQLRILQKNFEEGEMQIAKQDAEDLSRFKFHKVYVRVFNTHPEDHNTEPDIEMWLRDWESVEAAEIRWQWRYAVRVEVFDDVTDTPLEFSIRTTPESKWEATDLIDYQECTVCQCTKRD